MTLRTFYKKLRSIKNRYKWTLEDRYISAEPKNKNKKNKKFCPVCAVANAVFGTDNYVDAWEDGTKLGLNKEQIDWLVALSDNNNWDNARTDNPGYNYARNNLLKIVGLLKKPQVKKGK